MDSPQFNSLLRARDGLRSEPPGTANYQRYETLANTQIAQVEQNHTERLRQSPEMDPTFAAACADCVAGQPCCLLAFEVQDADDATRKVIWPNSGTDPRRLYMIAKEPYRGLPSGKVKVEPTERQACRNNAARPAVQGVGPIHDADHIMSTQEVTVTTPFLVPAFDSHLLPCEVMAAIYIAGEKLSRTPARLSQSGTVHVRRRVGP